MAGSILWSAPAFTSSSSVIRNSNIVIFEPHFDRPTEPIWRMSLSRAALCKSLANVPPLGGRVQDNNGAPGYSRVPSQIQLREWVKSIYRGSMPGDWCDFTVRQFLHESRPLHVCPNAWRYVQHWVRYISNSSCPPTSFLLPPLSITATQHFRKWLLLLHIFLPLKGKKEDECFDKRKICCNNSIRRSRSVYGKISLDSEMSVINMIIG